MKTHSGGNELIFGILFLVLLPTILWLTPTTYKSEMEYDKIRRSIYDGAMKRIHQIYGPFFFEYRKAVEKVMEEIPFEIDFDDIAILKTRIMEYRRYIEKPIIDSGYAKVNDAQSLSRHERALRHFDNNHLVEKTEFVQCLINGDDLSDNAEKYAFMLSMKISETIRNMPDDRKHSKQKEMIFKYDEFYFLLLTGQSIQQYYNFQYNRGGIKFELFPKNKESGKQLYPNYPFNNSEYNCIQSYVSDFMDRKQ